MKTDLKINRIVVVAEISDGRLYNVLCQEATQQAIISIINVCENGIKLLDKPIDGIEIIKRNEKAKM